MICFRFLKSYNFIANQRYLRAKICLIPKPRLEFNRIHNLPTSPKSRRRIRMASRADDAAAVLLTSGASGRINALLSLYALRSVWRLINAFFLILTLPFRGRRRSVQESAEKCSGKEEKFPAPTGKMVKVPAAMVPRKCAEAAVGKDVAARRAMAIRRVVESNEAEGFRGTVRDFSLLTTWRGDTIFTQSWTPVKVQVSGDLVLLRLVIVRGVVVLLHGLNEHSGRYDDFAKKLNANGFKVYGMDWIGHGGSDGLHAYVPSLDFAVTDMKAFLTKVVAENSAVPCFCFGHSTGGAIVLKVRNLHFFNLAFGKSDSQ
ncbi:alpha/beta-Hydrolases superfamily protein [Striga asiatica]|uniref:Alpha/beta-Hydrolases superfamily protein n=1 Tax=Striga asiatica TaxID=4170 RepID=A0A5A7R7S9_STRAF|nr:alpha/beta-Hydrolases superfamily protein [Striga asiatica]